MKKPRGTTAIATDAKKMNTPKWSVQAMMPRQATRLNAEIHKAMSLRPIAMIACRLIVSTWRSMAEKQISRK